MGQGTALAHDVTSDVPLRVASQLRISVPWAEVAAGVLAFSIVALLAANGGGYWPIAWSWTAFLLSWVAIVAILVFPPLSLSRTEQAVLVVSFALVGWIALAATWSESLPRTMLEVQRGAAYVGVVASCLVVVRASSYGSLLVGAWAGTAVVSAYSLATRLIPDRYGQFDPIAGYRCPRPLATGTPLGSWRRLESSSRWVSRSGADMSPARSLPARSSSSFQPSTSRSAAGRGSRSAWGSRCRLRSILGAFSSLSQAWRSPFVPRWRWEPRTDQPL